MKVAHVLSYFPPDRIGGVGEVARHVHQALLDQGHDSIVLTSGQTHTDPTVIRIAPTPGRFLVSAWRHAALVRRADIVHVHHGEALGLLWRLRASNAGPPILLTLHVSPRLIGESLRPLTAGGYRLGYGDEGFLRRTIGTTVRNWMDVEARRLATATSFISRSAARDVLQSPAADAATVIHNGVANSERSGPASPDPVELLFVGTGNVRKRVSVLTLVLANVRKRIPACRMRVIGFTPAPDSEFCRMANSLGVSEAFVLEGPLKADELPPFYRAAKVLLVPSAYEGLPMVILEAYQQGLPCVATRIGGHAEVIDDGENGYLVDVDRPEQMADAALRILENPELGRRMGDAGKRRVARDFSVPRQVKRYLALYDEVRARHAHGRLVGQTPGPLREQ